MELTVEVKRKQEGIIREAIWNFSNRLKDKHEHIDCINFLLALLANFQKEIDIITFESLDDITKDQFETAFDELLPKKDRRALLLIESFEQFKADVSGCDWELIIDTLTANLVNSSVDSQIIDSYENGLNQLITHFLPKSEISVFNPFAGIGSFAFSLMGNSEYFGSEIDKKVWAVGFMRLFVLRNSSNTHFYNWDSINRPYKSCEAAVLFTPFYGDKSEKLNEEVIFSLLETSISENGIIIWFVSPSFLRSTQSKGLIRKWLQKDLIEAIVELPSKLINKSNLSPACVVLNKQKTELAGKIKFIDLSLDYLPNRLYNKIDYDRAFDKNGAFHNAVETSNDKIIETDAYYDLRPSLYKLNEHIAQLEYSTSLNEVISERKGVKNEREAYKLVTASDLKDDFLECVTSYKDVKPAKLEPTKIHKIVEPSSLFISAVGEKLKPTYYKGAEAIAISPSILAYKIDDSIVDPEYLINQLISSDFERQLKLVRKSMSAFVRLNKDDFLKLVINSNNSIDEQRTIVNEIKDGLIQEKLDEIHKLKAKHNLGEDNNEQNALLRHAISLKLSNLLNSVKSIHEILDKQVFEKYSELQFLKKNESLKTNLKEYVDMAQKDAISIYNTVSISKKGMDGILSLEPVKIKFLEYIGNYKKRIEARETRNFEISLDIDFENLMIDEDSFAMPLINTHPDILDILFDNFIENAVRHAFTGEGPFKIWILVSADGPGNGDFLSISVSNNGERLPKGFSQEIFVQKGRSLNDGEGLGGWQIDQIIKKLGGHWDEIDDEQDDMGVWKIVTDMSTTFNFDIPCYYE